ncbi:unnamed protein product [Haemonchus placei]|uniref:Protein kinase domain-containing protein n=1 Tax=Haemonchus placei TaxID=6290 RepID=A0A0N4W4N2_HAEPC|nr:unnamed protein product [Haemonchus placei]
MASLYTVTIENAQEGPRRQRGRSRIHTSESECERSRCEEEFSQERAARQQADVEGQWGRRERESSEERTVRQRTQAERQRGKREGVSNEERAVQHQADVERQRGIRERGSYLFKDPLRAFNSALAMASMGAQVDTIRRRGLYCCRIYEQVYHRIGPLHLQEGEQGQYGQIYILDA